MLAEPPKPQRAAKRPLPKRENSQHLIKRPQRLEQHQHLMKPPRRNEPEKNKEVAKKSVDSESTSVEKSGKRGYYELNKLMTRMVDAELDDVIPKIEKVFSEVSPSEAECLRTIRDNTCDDLRNVLGLNITKRLLNVHNPLYIKIKFHGKPEKEDLREFLKKYHFAAFARKAVNIFAARLRNIEDFDSLCSDKNVQCGAVKMTVNPVYRFTSCPPNLITKYKDIIFEEEKSENQAVEEKDKKLTETTVNISPIKADPSTPIKSNEKTVDITAPCSKTTPQKSITTKTTSDNVKINESKITPQKPTEKATLQSSANTKTVASTTSPQKSTNATATSQSLAKTAPQMLTAEKTTTPINKTPIVFKRIPQRSTNEKPTAIGYKTTSNIPSQSKVTPTAIQAQKSTKLPTESKSTTKPSNTKTSNTVGNDYDELDDHDILALMSEGIVLDECSGSDED